MDWIDIKMWSMWECEPDEIHSGLNRFKFDYSSHNFLHSISYRIIPKLLSVFAQQI